MTGTIIHGVGGLYRVQGDDGTVYRCRARGAFRHTGMTPLVGDLVEISVGESEQAADKQGAAQLLISEILPRKNALIRPAMANLDVLFLVCAAREPEPSLLFLDKMLCIAESKSIAPILIVTKADIDYDRAEKLRRKYEKCGFPVFVTDNTEETGIDAIAQYIRALPKRTIAAFCGASGVGKSTLMNRLFPSLCLVTGAISEKIARGKHTTRSVSLYNLSELTAGQPDSLNEQDIYLADTPGFSMLDFERFDFFPPEELVYTFREFAPYIGVCRYKKCTHTKEDGCAILKAVSEKAIPKSRHKSYLALYEELRKKSP